MFISGPTYQRKGKAQRAFGSQAVPDAALDDLFGRPAADLRPVTLPSAPAIRSDSSPEEPPRKTRKPRTPRAAKPRPKTVQEEPDNDTLVTVDSGAESPEGDYAEEDVAQPAVGRRGKKKARKKQKSPDVEVPVAIRKPKFPGTKSEVLPMNQQELEQQAEIDEAKAYRLTYQDSEEYWRETKANAHRENPMSIRRPKDLKLRGPRHSRSAATPKRASKHKKPLETVAETEEVDGAHGVPVLVTPTKTHSRKSLHGPNVSPIVNRSPVVNPRIAQLRSGRNTGIRYRESVAAKGPAASTPFSNRKTRPLIDPDISAVDEPPILAEKLAESLQAQQEAGDNGDDWMLEDDPGAELEVGKGRKTPGASYINPPRRLTVSSGLARTRTLVLADDSQRNISARPEPSISRQPVLPLNPEHTLNATGDNVPAASNSRNHASDSVNPTLNLRTPNRTSAPPTASRFSHPTTLSQDKRREALPIFSPIVKLSLEDRHTATASPIARSHRKSVVVNARKGPLELILEISTPSHIIPTEHILGNKYTNLTKIGEGSFADVFSCTKDGQEVVLKIVPVNGHYIKNHEVQTTYEDILSESLISRELTITVMDEKLKKFFAPVFARTYFIKVARGLYPDEFGTKHDSFARANESNCLNQHPAFYPADQHFVIIGLNNGGEPLDTYPLTNFRQAKSVFQQVTMGLAVAEKALEFEHRDAHISNILIKPTTAKTIPFIYDGVKYAVPAHGVHVTIIDWTLSRMRQGNKTVYKDLQLDENIFKGHGDIQYDVYRYMRDGNKNNWETFLPRTNVLWLNYLQKKLLKDKNLAADPGDPGPRKDLLDVERRLRTYTSSMDLIEKAPIFQDCKVK